MARATTATAPMSIVPALAAGAFLFVLAVLTLLVEFGLPDAIAASVLTAAVVTPVVTIAFAARTMEPSGFYAAGRAVPAIGSGMAAATVVLSGAGYLGLAGAFFRDADAAVGVALGWSLGLLLLAVLIAPYFSRSGAVSVADFLGIRFGGRLVRLVAALVAAASLVAALAAAIATAVLVATILGIGMAAAVTGVVLIVIATTVLGGLQTVRATAIVQYLALAVGFVVPAAIVAYRDFSVPLPQMAIGEALARASRLAAATGDLALASPPGFLPLMPSGGLEFAAAVAVFAAGVAALPHLVPLSATVAGASAARRMVAWSLVLVLVVALTAPAYAAFARLAILTAVSQSAALPEWMIAFGKPGFVQTCGSDAASVEAIRAACLAAGRTRIGATDIAINGDAIVLAWPDIVGLPKLMGALAGVGALAAAVAAASAMAFAMGVLVGHDLYGRVLNVRSSAGRGLFASRIGMVAATLAGAWLGASYRQDVFALAFTGVSLPAAGLFPALVLAVWWKRTNAWGAAAGMLAGFAVTAAIIVDRRYPGLLPPSPVDFTVLAMPELTAAIVGMPVALVLTIVVSLITPRPSAERRAVLDRIRGARPPQPVQAAA